MNKEILEKIRERCPELKKSIDKVLSADYFQLQTAEGQNPFAVARESGKKITCQINLPSGVVEAEVWYVSEVETKQTPPKSEKNEFKLDLTAQFSIGALSSGDKEEPTSKRESSKDLLNDSERGSYYLQLKSDVAEVLGIRVSLPSISPAFVITHPNKWCEPFTHAAELLIERKETIVELRAAVATQIEGAE